MVCCGELIRQNYMQKADNYTKRFWGILLAIIS